MEEKSPSKRTRYNSVDEREVLNLSMHISHSQLEREDNGAANIEPKCDINLLNMKNKFQRWVQEMYKDSSKTKTITTKKYERIVRTLKGEIKNCAENSKFRFWMKCKGFTLIEEQPNVKSLYVLDKKGDELKYKKVAVVENFFDIIYNVHVNEGARGIKHAGQKRTHRSITETYAFLPREAVTKFLLCCSDCQRRTNDTERKFSPAQLSPSNNSNSCTNFSFNTVSPDLKSAEDSFSQTVSTYESNNNVVNSSVNDHLDNSVLDSKFNDDIPCNLSTRNIIENSYSFTELDENNEQKSMKTRKRKRKYTRKIIRLDAVTPGMSTTVSQTEYSDTSSKIENYRRIPLYDFKQHSKSTDFTYDTEKCPANDHDVFVQNSSVFVDSSTHGKLNPESNNHIENIKFVPDVRNCPYIKKISNVFHNPITVMENKTDDKLDNEEFLEQITADLILKAHRLDAVKEKLTENEKQQVSLKVYSYKIISFFLNYAADIMLRSIIADQIVDV